MKDLADKVLDYEAGNMSETEQVAFFQELVDTGTIHKLQGSYGRMAQHMTRLGLIRGSAEEDTEA